MKISFSETFSGARVETKYGLVFEKAPLIGDIYETHMTNGNVTLFRNVTQPHHTIMWWLERHGSNYFFGSSGGSEGFAGSLATFEVTGGGE
jgi:hypothetical protein